MKITSAIASANVILEYKNLKHLVKHCNLTPILSWTEWTDNSGNKLSIQASSTKIIKSKDIFSNDIFIRSNINHILENSYWIYLSDDYLFLMGNDNILRCYNILEKLNISPILSPFDLVKKVIDSFVSKESNDCFGFLNNLSQNLEEKLGVIVNVL